MTDSTEPIDPRTAAVEALRQALRNAGHAMYGAASDLARDQARDTVIRACEQVVHAAHAITERIDELRAIERDRDQTSEENRP